MLNTTSISSPLDDDAGEVTAYSYAFTAELGEHLLEIVHHLARCRDLPGVIDVLRRQVRRLVQADGITVVLREGDLCHYADEDAISPLWAGQRFPMEACISGWCMKHERQVAIADIYADDRIPHDAYRPTFVKSLAMTPIVAGEAVAALGAYWSSHHQATPQELYVLSAIALAAGTAIENARLVEQWRAEARRKDEFLATLAHELRNPLAPLGSGIALLRSSSDPLVAKVRVVMERQLQHLVRLLDDLLDASRVTRGVIELQTRLLAIAEIVAAAVEVSRPAIDGAGHELTFTVSTEPCFVEGDLTRLTQVLANVLNNAAKFTPAGGRITLGVTVEGDEVVFSVHDTGRGIPKDMLSSIFEMFAQVDVRRTSAGGLGIGLTLARKLVELHGGRMEARSEGEGRGSEFIIRLPRAGMRSER